MAPRTDNDPSKYVDDGTVNAVLEKYKNIKIYDAYKAALFDEIVERYQVVSDQLVQERDHFYRERKHLEDELAARSQNGVNSTSLLEPDPFVLVLIDGNDLIFRNYLLQGGDLGGREAAKALFEAVNQYAFSSIDNLPHDTKVVARIYVDVEDLSSLCIQHGIVDSPNKIKTFVRGFCQDKTLFDLVDVGSRGRATVYDKMEDNLRMFVFNKHCKHIIYGCADGEVYARVLKPYAIDLGIKQRITLLCGPQPDHNLASLQLETTQMTRIFRNTGVDSHKLIDHVSELDLLPSHLVGEATPPLSTPATSRSNSRIAQEGPRVQEVVIHSRQGSVASSVQSSEAQASQFHPSQGQTPHSKPKIHSFAMAAQKGAALKASPLAPKASPPGQLSASNPSSKPLVRRNKKGQRIDPPPPEFNKNEVDKVKLRKLCNAYYLRKDCPYADGKCTHDHMYKPSAQELETLKLVARMSACIHGSECDDPKCIYGHRCPFPVVNKGSKRGLNCINGENCRFPVHMHSMDTVAVSLNKIS